MAARARSPSDASATATRILLEANRGAAVVAIDPGSDLLLLDAVVRDTGPLDCAATTCSGQPLGLGLVSLSGAHVAAGRFVVTGCPDAGLQLAEGTMDLRYGEVSGNGIGRNVQIPGYDLARLTTDVVFTDNAVEVDDGARPQPDRVSGGAW